jgi:acetylornithine deacetylase
VVDGRENLIARVEGTAEGTKRRPGLLLNSHMDTVPVANMVIPPFDPSVSEGRVFGRGSCDAKGPLVAMTMALVRQARRPRRNAPVILLATVDEEYSFLGSRKFIETAWPVSAAVVGEPTRLGNIIAHKGIARWLIRVWGVSAHGATPELGQNAIYDAARVELLLESYAAELAKRAGHPLLGKAALNLGRVTGGQAVNMVPDLCELEIDRRLLPHEDGLEALRDCENWLRERLDNRIRFEATDPFLLDPALDTSPDALIVQAVTRSQTRTLGTSSPCQGAHYGTDGSKLSRVGIETVVCGPGDIAQAHTKAEFIEVDQLESAVRLYDDLIQNWSAND